MKPSIPLAYVAAFLPGLMALACHSGSGSRDAALTADVSMPSDTRALDVPSPEDTRASGDSTVPFDSRPDAPNGTDIGADLAPASEDGPDGATTFQCNFKPLVDAKPLSCERGQYCLAVGGGMAGNETAFSCAALPAACAGQPTCECLCGERGIANCTIPTSPGIHCLCLSDPSGPVLLCSAP